MVDKITKIKVTSYCINIIVMSQNIQYDNFLFNGLIL